MKYFLKIADGVDVVPLLAQLHRQPALWDAHSARRAAPGSPHGDMQDIWVRYNDEERFKETGDYSRFNDAHDPIFYPAWRALPALRPIVFGLMARCEATRLGGVLLTRIPPGGRIDAHTDRGWHVEYYNCKLYCILQSNPQCVNRTEDEFVAMKAGEVWTFDNTKEHEVVNNGQDDRITLIICLRCEA